MTTMIETQTETLICSNCNQSWEREVTRGRKPRFCQTCTRLPLGRTPAEPVQAPVERKTHAPRKHFAFPLLLTISKARKNAMLVGPAGSGKSTAGRQVAEVLDLPFVTKSCNPQMSEWDLMGFMGPNGYTKGVLRDAFEFGGVVLLDEMDASNPAVLTAINLIASLKVGEAVTFPDGENVERHPNFILVAGCNTFGDGASDQYVGREQLDAATLDRFMTVEWGYDLEIERMAAGNDEWSSYVQKARVAVAETGVDHLVTPRASIDGADLLRAGMSRRDVERVALWKGLDADSKRTVERHMRAMA